MGPRAGGSAKVRAFAERKRDRWVKPDELPALLSAFEGETDPNIRGALYLALLTGMRRGELLGLRWTDLDLNRCEVHLSQTKANRARRVPLVPEAVEILRSLPRLLGNPYVFPSPVVPGGRIYDLNRPWDRVRARMWLALHPDEAATLHARAAADVAARSKHADRSGDALQDRLYQLALERMKQTGGSLRFHDVRRTVGSMMALTGAGLPL